MGKFETIVCEPRRRLMFRVAAQYPAGSWIVLQVADLSFEPGDSEPRVALCLDHFVAEVTRRTDIRRLRSTEAIGEVR